MKPGKYWGKTIPGFKRLRFFLPIFLVIIILSLLFAPLSALGGNPQTEKKKVTKLRDDWVKGDGKHYLGLNPPAPGNNNSKMLAKLPQQNLLNLPTSVDLSSQLPPVGDQGAQGSCVAWATCYYHKSWLEKQEHSSWSLTDPTHQFSPSFTYNQIKDPFGGSFIHKALYYLANQGDVDLAEMPYNPANDTTLPTAAQFEAAKAYRNSYDWGCFFNHEVQGPYGAPNNVENLKAWLAAGKTLVIGIPVYYDFPAYNGNSPAPYYDYNGKAAISGGHAVCISGYNNNINPSGADADHRGGFKMVNSWGSGWNGASAGYLYLSYDFLKNYVWDAWAAYDKSPDSPSISSLSATAGNPGDSIHIYGSNLGTLRRNARVTFNGVAATTVKFSDTDITLTVPSGASTGPVIVYDWEGTPSNQLTFTVGASSPSVTSASPSYATQNTNVSTTLTGSNFTSGCTARLVKDATVINASSVTFVSSTQVNCSFSLAGTTAGAYDIIVKNPSGTEGRLHNGFTMQPANSNILNCSTPNLGIGYPICSQPSLSADGRYVAFFSSAELIPGIGYSIYRRDLQTGEIVNCLCDAAGARVPGFLEQYAAISATGRYVAFATDNSNPNTNLDQVYLKDLQTGALSCCSTNASGTLGDGWSKNPCISSDGRYVAFLSTATNLVPNDTNGTNDIFRKDLQTGAIICCSTDAAGNIGNDISGLGGSGPSITPDGRYVAFQSWASNLVPGDYNWWSDIFRKDCVTGEVRCCSVDTAGNMDFNSHDNQSISADGRYVAFTAGGWTTLVPGCDNCQVVRKDLQTGEVLACTADVYGDATGNQVNCTAISADGRYVAFGANENTLVPGEVGDLSIYSHGQENWDIFRKDLVTGEIVCCATDAVGNWENMPFREYGGVSISGDGRYVAFESGATNLVPGLPLGNYVFRKDCGAINVPRISSVSPSSAKQGTEITITGSGFGSTRGTSKVEFGMIDPASYTAWSDTQIKCIVPSNVVGDVLLRVVTASSVSNLKAFKITLYPAPTVSSITPNAGDQNTTVSITNLAGTNFVSGATVHLERGTSIINASNVAVVSSNQITCNFNLTNVATGAYDVVVTNQDGLASRLTGGFTVNAPVSPCGAGAGTLSFVFGVVMGLLSLAGSGGLFQRSRRKRKKAISDFYSYSNR